MDMEGSSGGGSGSGSTYRSRSAVQSSSAEHGRRMLGLVVESYGATMQGTLG